MPQTTGNESFSSQRIFRSKGISKCCLYPLVFLYNLFLMLRLDTRNPIPALPKHTSNPLQTICHLCVKLPAANLLLANLHLSWQKNKRKKEKKKYCRMRKLNPHLSLAISSHQSSAHYLHAPQPRAPGIPRMRKHTEPSDQYTADALSCLLG